MKKLRCPSKARRNSRIILSTLVVQLLSSSMHSAWATTAAATTGGANHWPELDYPELLVVPRASARIEMEKKRESETLATRMLPIQLGSVSLLSAGVAFALTAPSATDDERKERLLGSVTSIGIGGAWLAASFALNAFYQPYETASQEIASYPGQSKRDQLTRERMSEEALYSASRTGTLLKWSYGVSQAVGSLSLMSRISANEDPIPMVLAASALGFSLAPFIFPSRWETVNREQQDYRRRIFTPVASAFTVLPPMGEGVGPSVLSSFRWTF